ncbi:MAG: HAMP domain-containing histidine kinase [Clostridia bacterium]|nr:HAMP domain-containing histidine kinase [Clostridia bacterium]
MTLSGIDSAKIAKCAEEINANASKMSMLISDMLYMSRLDADINNEELQLVDLGKVCREICEEISISADMSDIQIKFEGSAFAKCYPKMMYTAITNLVSNAVKYGKKGGSVWVKAGETDSDIYIEVKDNGIGISEENQDRVFERFFKVDTARTGSDEVSTGLGLAIVKHIIVNIHKGVISLESVLGEGSVFKIVLPKENEGKI